jgi:hypothetical protein
VSLKLENGDMFRAVECPVTASTGLKILVSRVRFPPCPFNPSSESRRLARGNGGGFVNHSHIGDTAESRRPWTCPGCRRRFRVRADVATPTKCDDCIAEQLLTADPSNAAALETATTDGPIVMPGLASSGTAELAPPRHPRRSSRSVGRWSDWIDESGYARSREQLAWQRWIWWTVTILVSVIAFPLMPLAAFSALALWWSTDRIARRLDHIILLLRRDASLSQDSSAANEVQK